MVADKKKSDEREAPAGGAGLCSDAQADGVPCTELGKDCEICDRAFRNDDSED
jgi:hypothetical protein